MNIQLRHVRSFLAVASEKSFARAATRLSVSQPALSQTIQQLERTLGFELFERTTRSVELTKQGEALQEKALKLNRALDSFHSDIRELQLSLTNKIRLGYLIGTAVDLMPDITREFERRKPNASIELIEFDFNDPDAGLATNQVDCSIIRPPLHCQDVEIIELARERCVVCLSAGHRLAAQETVRVEQILDEPIIAAPGTGIWRDYWLACDYRGGNPPNVVYEAATVDGELQAVANRRGISITAESTAKYYARPGVIFRPIENMADCIIAIGFRDSTNPLVKEMVSIAKEVAERHLGR